MNSPLIDQPVSYQYSKNWLRYGTVIELDKSKARARVRWTSETYTGTAAGVPNGPLDIRTWVALKRLSFDNIAAAL